MATPFNVDDREFGFTRLPAMVEASLLMLIPSLLTVWIALLFTHPVPIKPYTVNVLQLDDIYTGELYESYGFKLPQGDYYVPSGAAYVSIGIFDECLVTAGGKNVHCPKCGHRKKHQQVCWYGDNHVVR